MLREYRNIFIRREETGLGGKRKYCYVLYYDNSCKRYVQCEGSRPGQGDFNTLKEAKAHVDYMAEQGELNGIQ